MTSVLIGHESHDTMALFSLRVISKGRLFGLIPHLKEDDNKDSDILLGASFIISFHLLLCGHC
jgi:hypothetical protein